jgi:Flp pilus assembly pilin Flp
MRVVSSSRRRPDESGATAVEYALLLSLIVAVIFVGMGALGVKASDLFDRNCNEVATATAGATC